jgi:NAD(P)-dependent dehydrogenase (short-subunit alcohol dehydrogenase family)
VSEAGVIVTGGLGRLGRALADALERRGAVPVLTSRDAERVERFNAEAKAAGRKARARVLAFTDEAETERFVDGVLAERRAIEGLVNNAYPALPYVEAENTGWRVWMEAARVGLGLPLTLAASLVRRKCGLHSIVNVASMYGIVAPDFSIYPPGREPSTVHYGAIKAALIQQTRYLAALWAPLGVRVNAVSPGGIFDHQDAEFLRRYNATVPAGRMVTREEVAATIGFLLAREAGGITGENVVIDGGRTIR